MNIVVFLFRLASINRKMIQLVTMTVIVLNTSSYGIGEISLIFSFKNLFTQEQKQVHVNVIVHFRVPIDYRDSCASVYFGRTWQQLIW